MGATTWTMRVVEGGRPLDVVFFPSANVNRGVRLVGNPRYPQIADDFARSFATWRALPCDVFLGVHGDFYDMEREAPPPGAAAARTRSSIPTAIAGSSPKPRAGSEPSSPRSADRGSGPKASSFKASSPRRQISCAMSVQ